MEEIQPDGVAAVVGHVVGGDEHQDDGEVLVMKVSRDTIQKHRGPRSWKSSLNKTE